MNNEIKQFSIHKYGTRYYRRHLDQYREWEIKIGKTIVETFKPSSILDLGCGVGSYLEGALQSGCKDILGIEIAFEKAKEFLVKDITPFIQDGDITIDLKLNRSFDCVMSIEVGEHIEPSGTNGFIDNLTKLSTKYILLTAAPPGQGGTGHINLREKEWWIQEIKNRGWTFRQDFVDSFIKKWSEIQKELPPGQHLHYIIKNLMVFTK